MFMLLPILLKSQAHRTSETWDHADLAYSYHVEEICSHLGSHSLLAACLSYQLLRQSPDPGPCFSLCGSMHTEPSGGGVADASFAVPVHSFVMIHHS